ncbi:MAG: hypothetical protein ACSHXB_04925 [Sulfitobacter sp.]
MSYLLISRIAFFLCAAIFPSIASASPTARIAYDCGVRGPQISELDLPDEYVAITGSLEEYSMIVTLESLATSGINYGTTVSQNVQSDDLDAEFRVSDTIHGVSDQNFGISGSISFDLDSSEKFPPLDIVLDATFPCPLEFRLQSFNPSPRIFLIQIRLVHEESFRELPPLHVSVSFSDPEREAGFRIDTALSQELLVEFFRLESFFNPNFESWKIDAGGRSEFDLCWDGEQCSIERYQYNFFKVVYLHRLANIHLDNFSSDTIFNGLFSSAHFDLDDDGEANIELERDGLRFRFCSHAGQDRVRLC